MKRIFSLLSAIAFALALAAPSAALSTKNGAILSGGTERRRIALTFDDGPHPSKTDAILDLLAEYDIHATFFLIGENAAFYPDIVRREYAEGHEIGNHTFHHRTAGKCERAYVEEELAETEDLILELTGHVPTLFRPPEGFCSEYLMTAAKKMNCRIVLWNVDPRDWAKTSTEEIVRNVKANVKNGSIVLFHDYTGKGAHTLDALKILLPWLIGEGYEIVTVSELLSES